MDCILFRHGIAVDREEWEGQEEERPLTRKGVERTREAASGLLRLGVTPAHILSSPLVRALETARIIQEVHRLRGEIQVCEELLPDAPPEKLFPLLGSLVAEPYVFFVGHEPHLSAAASMMLFGKPDGGLALKKAGAGSIRYESEPRPGDGMLRWWMGPAQLRMIR
jgi:phosphohistidine phosphatase